MTNPFDEHPSAPVPRRTMLAALRASFFTGLVVVAPIGLTAYLIWTVTGWFDGWVLNFVPRAYHPGELINRLLGYDDPLNQLPVNVRGIGVVIFLVFTVVVGWLAKGLLGRSFIKWAESLVDRTPVVSSVYNGLKQIAETVFAQTETSFDQACMVEYPRKGTWAIGFVSTTAKGEVAAIADDGDPLISIFVPTTPNPTSGFLLFFPKSEVKILDMTVEDAAKLVISAGLVYPNGKDGVTPPKA
ncbi:MULTISPECIES: DUF502 domain-containing protein [Pacificibacter]|uniref:DUF502 domain-containing protein n=1 Tax=Pacificibacter TaxID=1042323 RepID=UPI001C096A57|nr:MULTISPECIES: DUF502 domain-containing protein [Pacificibacter]MBU2935019.1 DUF502 domain-containing protein [Pacificibacter marinus]MDO6617100.1 DUF502 domain-containing protein [Pacificibacter sp. 1_MG-2023]